MLSNEKPKTQPLNQSQKMPYNNMRPKDNKRKKANNLKKTGTNISSLSNLFEKTTLEVQPQDYFLTEDIHFSQASISSKFRNGTLIADLSEKLIAHRIDISEISCIRVVQFQDKWLTLDNRRLRAFKDAVIPQTPVHICSLNDPEIYREFHEKRTNKSSEGGGVMRRPALPGTTQHFEGGTFTFVKRILNLSLEQLEKPIRLHSNTPMPIRFHSTEEYHEGFLELILEEARASLQAGIEAKINNENVPFQFVLQADYKPPKNYQNPAPIIFSKKPNERRMIKANDAFLLTYQSRRTNIQLLALASYTPSEDLTQVQLKIVPEEDMINTSYAFQAGAKWFAKPIGSLVTHLRMFDVCTIRPDVLWMETLLSGNLNKNTDSNLPSSQYQFPVGLNPSQQAAVNKFLKLDCGIQLVQGPPGTGKTTMVVGLLALLTQQGRTLVCAPSNKAIQLLAERFSLKYPNTPVILAGVEDKIPDDNDTLKKIFIHSWGSRKLGAINGLMEDLWTLFPSLLFIGTAENRLKKIKAAILKMDSMEKHLIALLPDFKKYDLNILTDAIIDNFKRIGAQYVHHMTEKGIPLAKKRKIISKKDLSAPQKFDTHFLPFLDETSTILGEAIALLSQVALTLNLKINDDSKHGLEGELLNKSQIIFTTLSVSGRKGLQEMDPVNALVIDEAGQAVEAETLIPLVTRPKKCLLIGDTNQLPATVISQKAAKLGFERSLIWRLLKDCHQPYSMLTTQYRMHPEIRLWPSKQYYGSRITDSNEIATGKRAYITTKEIPSFIAPYSFIHVEGQETKTGRSFKNQQEADSIATILQYLKNHLSLNVARQVSIITFYKGQATLLNEKIAKVFPGIKVNTVDSFQGDENDVIIISSVRSNASGKIGFLNDFRRLNVALTRAKHGLMIIGNAYALKKEKHDLALLVKDAETRKCFYRYDTIKTHLEPKPQLLAFDAERAKKLKSPITHTPLQPNITINNPPDTTASSQNCVFLNGNLESKVPMDNTKKANKAKSHIAYVPIDVEVAVSHKNNGITKKTQLNAVREEKNKPKNKSTLCRFDQKNSGSRRKGASCNFLHGNNQPALSTDTAQKNLNKLSKLPTMNLNPKTSTTTLTTTSKVTTPTITALQNVTSTTMPAKSIPKPGSATAITTPTIASKAATLTTTSQIEILTKTPATSTLRSGGATTSTTTSAIAFKTTMPIPKPGMKISTTISQISTAVSSTVKTSNAVSEKRLNNAKKEGLHRPPLPKMQPKLVKE